MTLKASEYRRKAEEAQKAAQVASDPEARRAYENIANAYRELAALGERNAARSN